MDHPRILIVEDNLEYSLFLKALIQLDAEVTLAPTIKEAREQLNVVVPQLILLDVAMGAEDGFDFCAEIKAVDRWKEVPVVFLTVKQETRDKVTGFSLGADDYIVKSSDPLEVQARIRAILRRTTKKINRELFALAGIKLDFTLQRALIEESSGMDSELELTPTEFKILGLLMRHEGRTFSRQLLLEEIFGHLSGTGRTVDTHVHSLRKKMKAHSTKVESVFGAGYRFRAKGNLESSPNV